MEHLNKYYKFYLVIGGLLITAITYLVILELRIPKDADEMTTIRDHVNEVPSDVENYKREVTLIEQQSVLIEQSQKMDSFYGFAIKKFTKDSIIEAKKERSRAGRDSTNKSIDKKLDYILKLVDTIN